MLIGSEMKKLILSVIRYILTMFLLYGIYTETGIWTTIAFLLIVITHEQIDGAVKRIKEALDIWGE